MAGPTKKSCKPSTPESDEEFESDDSNSYHGQQEIQATFEGRNPEGIDFNGIKQLLNQLFLKAHVDLSQMSDMIIAQTGIGSVLKQSMNDSDDDEDMEMTNESDVFGVTSIINLSSHKETPCVQQFFCLVDELSTKHASNEDKTTFKDLANKGKLALIINERFVNIPAKVSGPMLEQLKNELERMKKKDDSYNFDYFVMILKTWKPKGDKIGELMYSNDEEQLFSQAADSSFFFCVADKSGTGLSGHWKTEDTELVPYRQVILFKADKLNSIVTNVLTYLNAY